MTGIFLPECTLFESITVLVKPGFMQLVPLIRRCLTEHKYHIVVEKSVQMSESTAQELISRCQKVKVEGEVLKQIVRTYSRQQVHLFCLSKISGKKEIMSMLSGFSFLSAQQQGEGAGSEAKDEYISDEVLCETLVPVWNS
jgi:hypothetical protein